MQKTATRVRPVVLTTCVLLAASCGSSGRSPAIDPALEWEREWASTQWQETQFGGYTIVRRPAYIVDNWTTRAFNTRPYRKLVVSRQHELAIVYAATDGARLFEVNLTPLGSSTRIEVRARMDGDHWDQKQAKLLLGRILGGS